MGVWISFQRFVKSLEHKRIVISVTENIGNDSPVAQVQNGTQKDFMYRDSLIPLEFRYIRMEMSRNVQSGNTQKLKSSAAPVKLPAAPAPTPGTSQAAAPAGCAYRS